MIKNIIDLEKSLKLKEGTLKSALEAPDEVEIEIPKLKVRTEDEEIQFVDNLKNEFKTAGREIAIKEAREKHGLEFQGKHMDNLLENFKAKVLKDADVNPDKRVVDLTTDLTTVRTNLEKVTNEYNTFKANIEVEKERSNINNMVLSEIPDNTIIGKSELLTLFNSKFAAEKQDNGAIVFKTGNEVLKDKTTMTPLSAKEIVKDFIAPYLGKPVGGSGQGDETGGSKPGSLDAFMKEMADKNISQNSESFNKEMQKRIQNKTLIM